MANVDSAVNQITTLPPLSPWLKVELRCLNTANFDYDTVNFEHDCNSCTLAIETYLNRNIFLYNECKAKIAGAYFHSAF